MSGTYKQKTKSLGIPVLGYKDGISPEVELRKWQLVENLLLAATRSFRNCIFQEGIWSVRDLGEEYRVGLAADSINLKPSISGVMKGVYFEGGPSIVWDGLSKNTRSYLYIAPKKETRFNPRAIRSYSREATMGLREEMLVAIFDGTTGQIEKYPQGKVYSESLSAPGAMLHPVTVDFESGGKNGFEINMTRRISFVQVSRIHAGNFNGTVGELSIGYFGQDENVEKVTQTIVYNTGDEGIPMRALVFCG